MLKEVSLLAVSLTLFLHIHGSDGCCLRSIASLLSDDGDESGDEDDILDTFLSLIGLTDEDERRTTTTKATTTASTTTTTATTTSATTTTAPTTPAAGSTTASSNATTAATTEKPK